MFESYGKIISHVMSIVNSGKDIYDKMNTSSREAQLIHEANKFYAGPNADEGEIVYKVEENKIIEKEVIKK